MNDTERWAEIARARLDARLDSIITRDVLTPQDWRNLADDLDELAIRAELIAAELNDLHRVKGRAL